MSLSWTVSTNLRQGRNEFQETVLCLAYCWTFPVISEKIARYWNNYPAGVETTAEFFLGINATGQLKQNKNNYWITSTWSECRKLLVVLNFSDCLTMESLGALQKFPLL